MADGRTLPLTRLCGQYALQSQSGHQVTWLSEVQTLVEMCSAQNIYVCEFDAFLECCLVLFGESGRREFFLNTGKSLDGLRADIAHREAWRDLLNRL